MPGRMEFEFGFRRDTGGGGRRPGSGEPFRILLVGDFSGRANRGAMEVGDSLLSSPILSIDVDSFDERMRRLEPRLDLPVEEGGGAAVEVSFDDLDSFHPDELFDRLDLFQALRRNRKMLLKPETFAQAVAELRQEGAVPDRSAEAAGGEASPAETAASEEDDSSTLERLLGSAPARPTGDGGGRRGRVDLSSLLRNVVAPHIVPNPDPRQDDMVAAVDRTLSALMGRILHHPEFQTLESAWRGVWSLVTGLETEEDLQIHLLDVSKAELAADFAGAGGDLSRTGFHRLVVEKQVETVGGTPWAAIVVDARFGPNADDIALLAALGAVASRAGGPVLAGGSPALLGLETLVGAEEPRDWPSPSAEAGELWQAFRECPSAAWVGLGLPRLLMRLPYGEGLESLDRFAYDELGPDRPHESYLWGNPGYALALLLGRAFTASGWSMTPGDLLDLGDLPTHVFEEEGEKRMQACAEIYLSERAADAVLSKGIMPLMSYKNRDAVRIARFQSCAEPPAALRGPWQ